MIPILDMFSLWWSSASPTGDWPRDINGVAITPGATVKFVGTVIAVNTSDPHFGDIQVIGINPTGIPFIVESRLGNPQSPNFVPPDPIKVKRPLGFHPLQLIVGS